MKGKITIDRERCKGCGLCISVCKPGCIAINEDPNTKGYFPAQPKNAECCIACKMCALMCPDVAITVAVVTQELDEPLDETDTPIAVEK